MDFPFGPRGIGHGGANDRGHGDEGIRDIFIIPRGPGMTFRECFDVHFRHVGSRSLYYFMMSLGQGLVPDTLVEFVDMHRDNAAQYYDLADDTHFVPSYNIETLDEVLELPDEFFPRRDVMLFNRWADAVFTRWGYPFEFGGTLLRFLYWYAGDRWLANHVQDEGIDDNEPEQLLQQLSRDQSMESLDSGDM